MLAENILCVFAESGAVESCYDVFTLFRNAGDHASSGESAWRQLGPSSRWSAPLGTITMLPPINSGAAEKAASLRASRQRSRTCGGALSSQGVAEPGAGLFRDLTIVNRSHTRIPAAPTKRPTPMIISKYRSNTIRLFSCVVIRGC